MNLYGISNILIVISSLSMGIFVYAKGYKHRLTKVWPVFALSVAAYGFGAYMVTLVKSADEAIFWWKIAYIGIITIPFMFLYFVYDFFGIRRPIIIILHGLAGLVFLIANFFSRELFLTSAKLFFIGYRFVKPIYFIYPVGPMLFAFIAFYFTGTIAYTLFEVAKRYKTAKGVRRNQLQYFFVATAIGFIGGGLSFLPCFNIEFYPILNFAVILSPIIMTYAIFRYRLLDIRIAVTRAGVFFAVYLIVLGLPFVIGYRILGRGLWTIPLITMAAFATAGPFIYAYLQRKAENRLLHKQRVYQQALLHASQGMLLIKDLNKLLKLITRMLVRTIGLNHTLIYLQDPETGKYMLKAKRERKKISVETEILGSDSLIKYLKKESKPVLYGETANVYEEDMRNEIISGMEKISARLIVPSFMNENLIGFLVMSDKLSGALYTQDDLGVFQILANQAALAIENAMFYEETGKSLAQQFHEHRLRSIGKMGSYMGHQINNRFHAVLIHAERIRHLALKKLKPTITDKQKELFNKAEESLGIIEENAKRGGSIIDRLRAFSRKETTFKSIDFNEVIKATLELLSCKFDINELNIKIEVKETPLKVYGDIAQLQDVFFNLLDNAHDAQQLKKENQPDYIPKTSIKAYTDEEQWHIEISDNGAGIKKEELEQLFLPFFTTKATSEKGTGIGMAVIKIMIENNKGTIEAESEYNRGTTFYITLPAINQKEPENA